MNTITATITVPTQSLTEAGKARLLAYADTLVAGYHEEGYDVLGLLAESAKLELLAARIKEKAKEVALTEVSLYGREGVSKLGVSMTIKPVGVSYDYSGDRIWQELNRTVLVAIERRKQQEEILKSLPYEGRIMVDENTGEEYRAYPPVKTGTDGIILKIE
ncbi:hypothetical protein G8759_25290 [Spirosoma aureum]|uniref:Uncharacterized protein n=1 Tax=Spirosoma aureum TaxID=2692134 RepID=A0A6G9ATB0_9BACT|nr:hypothetical protein [Spirosoma aureum]QIP15711.1 hypothetical protein G8759_25290 [Spirosoma aureum]